MYYLWGHLEYKTYYLASTFETPGKEKFISPCQVQIICTGASGVLITRKRQSETQR
jgi:hypothetical protein